MANPMLDRLRKGKNGAHFVRTQTLPSYQTGFMNLDYYNGYMLNALDNQNNIIAKQEVVGLVGGSFTTIVGKSGVAKSTAAIQIASNIVRPFASSFVQHFDVEGATNNTRVRNVTQMTNAELTDKYVLKQDMTDIEDIYESCMEVYKEKESNRKDYEYDTGLKNEYGEPIIALEPTVMILDSIPTVSSRAGSDEMEGGTYANRIAKGLAQFYKRMTPIIKRANIIFIAINHINAKMEINPFAKSQPQLLYLKMDESLPGGNAPVYYANNLIKFVSCGKFTQEKEGFDGFRVRAEFLKSRTNKAGKSTTLVYNQDIGFDPILTQLELIEEHKLLNGRNPYRFIGTNQDVKFSTKNFREEFRTRPELQDVVFNTTLPILKRQISDVYGEEKQDFNSHIDILQTITSAYDRDLMEEFDKKIS